MREQVELHVDELVLHGIPPADAEAVGAALRARLADLIALDPPRWTVRDEVDAGLFTPAGTPAQTGTRIADAVYRGLAR